MYVFTYMYLSIYKSTNGNHRAHHRRADWFQFRAPLPVRLHMYLYMYVLVQVFLRLYIDNVISIYLVIFTCLFINRWIRITALTTGALTDFDFELLSQCAYIYKLCKKINRLHANAHDSRTNHSHEHRASNRVNPNLNFNPNQKVMWMYAFTNACLPIYKSTNTPDRSNHWRADRFIFRAPLPVRLCIYIYIYIYMCVCVCVCVCVWAYFRFMYRLINRRIRITARTTGALTDLYFELLSQCAYLCIIICVCTYLVRFTCLFRAPLPVRLYMYEVMWMCLLTYELVTKRNDTDLGNMHSGFTYMNFSNYKSIKRITSLTTGALTDFDFELLSQCAYI